MIKGVELSSASSVFHTVQAVAMNAEAEEEEEEIVHNVRSSARNKSQILITVFDSLYML